MRKIHLLILPLLLVSSVVSAMGTISPMMHFAAMFPSLSRTNIDNAANIASNGQSEFTASGILYPENEIDLLQIVTFHHELQKFNQHMPPLVIAGGSRRVDNNMKSGWSFDSHAHGHDGDIILSTSKLSGIYRAIDWRKDFDQEKGVVKVWALAGTPWRRLVDMVNDSYQRNTDDDDNYFVPMISPTGSNITIGGSFASNTHARGTSVMGGYFADTIDAFNIVTIVDDEAGLMTVRKERDPELFYALVGSFGRGGIVSAIQINLQMVAKNKVATTKVKKVFSIEEMTKAFAQDRTRMMASVSGTRTDRNAFLASVGLISADFDTFFMLENDLEVPNSDEESFPLYGAPDSKAMFIQKAARAVPKLADFVASKYLDSQCAKNPCEFFTGNCTGTGEFHDQPLNNYIFFQDSFARNIIETEAKDHQTAHLTLMLRLENLPRATAAIKEITERREFRHITYELQDLLPLPSTRVLMAPGYSPEDNDDIYIAYTISWAVENNIRDESHRLERALEAELFAMKINGEPLAWLHPLKEFSFKNGPIEFYKTSAQKLEAILEDYGISDRELFYSRIHDYLYQQH